VVRRRDSIPPLGSSSQESELSRYGSLGVALVVVVDSLYLSQILLRFLCWCRESPPFHEVLQSTPDPSAVQDFLHFPLFFALDDHRKRWWNDMPWD
jgi:hypothetical protein